MNKIDLPPSNEDKWFAELVSLELQVAFRQLATRLNFPGSEQLLEHFLSYAFRTQPSRGVQFFEYALGLQPLSVTLQVIHFIQCKEKLSYY